MEEPELRNITRDWYKKRYQSYEKHLEFINLHEMGITITEFLVSRFKGDSLTSIPQYNRLYIKPDIIGIIIHPKTYQKLWIIAECKAGSVSQRDLGQALKYSGSSAAFASSLCYHGRIGRAVQRDIENGHHFFNGSNQWGAEVRKNISFYQYDLVSARFTKMA